MGAARDGDFLPADANASERGFTVEQRADVTAPADEFMVHLNSVEQWRQRWKKLAGRAVRRSSHWPPEEMDVRTAAASPRRVDVMESIAAAGPRRAVLILFAATQPRTQPHRDTLEARQVLLASVLLRQRLGPTCRDSVADGRFRQRIHCKF